MLDGIVLVGGVLPPAPAHARALLVHARIDHLGVGRVAEGALHGMSLLVDRKAAGEGVGDKGHGGIIPEATSDFLP